MIIEHRLIRQCWSNGGQSNARRRSRISLFERGAHLYGQLDIRSRRQVCLWSSSGGARLLEAGRCLLCYYAYDDATFGFVVKFKATIHFCSLQGWRSIFLPCLYQIGDMCRLAITVHKSQAAEPEEKSWGNRWNYIEESYMLYALHGLSFSNRYMKIWGSETRISSSIQAGWTIEMME